MFVWNVLEDMPKAEVKLLIKCQLMGASENFERKKNPRKCSHVTRGRSSAWLVSAFRYHASRDPSDRLGRNRSFLFNCGLHIVEVLQEGFLHHALEEGHGNRF